VEKFLESLNPDLREAIERVGERVEVKSGEPVFTRGEVGAAFYIIQAGSVRIHDDDLVLNRLGEGDAFGEIAGLSGQERTASVTAETDLAMLRVERDKLYELLKSSPESLLGLVQMLCERESGMADRITNRSWQLHLAQRELEIGRKIQAGFLPDALPDLPGYEIASHFQAARVVAGDFYDAFEIPSIARVAVVIGDVCDKGVGAALFMTLFRSLIRAAAQSEKFIEWAVDHDPGGAAPAEDEDLRERALGTLRNTVALTNNYVAATHGKTSMFASAFIGLLDPTTGHVDYVNAGHEEAYVVGSGGIRQALPPTGPVLGLFPGAAHGMESISLGSGETLLLYSDGVPEATSRSGEQFSDERLRSLFASPMAGARGLVSQVVEAVSGFVEEASQHDDITMLAVHRRSG
jgi:sigma-B regulation protein RsbU (phosphoserine phosphatase)